MLCKRAQDHCKWIDSTCGCGVRSMACFGVTIGELEVLIHGGFPIEKSECCDILCEMHL